MFHENDPYGIGRAPGDFHEGEVIDHDAQLRHLGGQLSQSSPEIYKLIAENEQYRVIEVTWKPGQRDQFHSHPTPAVYYVTDCSLGGYGPSGALGQRESKAGTAIVQAPIPSHSVENFGQSVCKLIMFESK